MGWTDESAADGAFSDGSMPRWGEVGLWWGIANLFWGIGYTHRQGIWTDESAADGAWSSE